MIPFLLLLCDLFNPQRWPFNIQFNDPRIVYISDCFIALAFCSFCHLQEDINMFLNYLYAINSYPVSSRESVYFERKKDANKSFTFWFDMINVILRWNWYFIDMI